jgi:hypothetical protein
MVYLDTIEIKMKIVLILIKCLMEIYFTNVQLRYSSPVTVYSLILKQH